MFDMGKKPTYETFLASLNWCMKEKGISQSDLAIDTGLSNEYISYILSRKKNAGFNSQVKIAEACGYEYAYFLRLNSSCEPKRTPDHIKEEMTSKQEIEYLKEIVGMLKEKNQILEARLKEFKAGSAIRPALGEEYTSNEKDK